MDNHASTKKKFGAALLLVTAAFLVGVPISLFGQMLGVIPTGFIVAVVTVLVAIGFWSCIRIMDPVGSSPMAHFSKRTVLTSLAISTVIAVATALGLFP